jgi:hypothetical protein
VIKPLVLHGQSKLHPLLALLSVLGGIQALGPVGIVVGPMVVVFLQTLLKILQRELLSIDRSPWTLWRGFGATAASTSTSAAPAPTTVVINEPAAPPTESNPPAGPPTAPQS